MKLPRLFAALPLLLVSVACSQDALLEKPREYRPTANKTERRANDKSHARREHHPIGLGLDLHARNPHKFRMVNAPKPYKFSRPKGY